MLKPTCKTDSKQCQNLHIGQFVLEGFQNSGLETVAPVAVAGV